MSRRLHSIGTSRHTSYFMDFTFVDPLLRKKEIGYVARGFGKNKGPLLPFAPEATSKTV